MQHHFAIEEIIVKTATKDFSKRIRSFELLYELLAEQGNDLFGQGSESKQEKTEATIT
ncbi:hypothetical protein [Paenibacillus silvae]|uniref:hypothetical protein n=1 Tax=Paenibacillus silvae TaxID=1325358 RepID=UPI0020068F91|nr:hypothetical protein [Paenibacillus silvae]MCK6076180.1 hypothetical protein [Paenibacillus silvae]MCK6150661.1 hypothetical protein [Paenibacillus silvae]MCK6268920.1 hypothetical protein [Paenibacillus silvae]